MPHPAKEQSDEHEDGHLRGERFRRGDPDLRTRVHVNAAVAFARDGARDVVANAEGAIPLAPAFPHRAEGVGGFAALADREDYGVARHRGIAMAKLAREFHFRRNPRELLEDVFADHGRMQRRAAAGQDDAADIAQLRGRHVEAAEFGGAFFRAETAAHGIAHRAWLLKDFLEHVMRVIALPDVFVGELDFADFVGPAFAGDRADLEFVALDRDDIEVVQVNRVARVSDDRADVAGEKIFVFANTEDERAAAARADDEVRNVLMDERDAISADDLLQRRAHCRNETAFIVNGRSARRFSPRTRRKVSRSNAPGLPCPSRR